MRAPYAGCWMLEVSFVAAAKWVMFVCSLRSDCGGAVYMSGEVVQMAKMGASSSVCVDANTL
jgi:hypothetical protein